MTAERHVLVLAYFFPPLGGAGVQRTLKHVKYLPEHGWRATVVTTASTAYPVSDPSLLHEIPRSTRVVRAPEPALWNRLVTLALMAGDRLRLRTLAGLVAWPDAMVPWAPGALLAARREIRRSRPDAILTTSAPYSAHLVGWLLHRVTGIPWVADFRDEWANNPHTLDQPAVVRHLNSVAERAITAAATRLTVVADYFRIAGAAHRPPVVIPNGVDEADLPDAPPEPPANGRFRLSYVGTMYADQDCAPVLAALRRLVAAGRVDPEEVELRAVGNVWITDLEAATPVSLTVTGYVDHMGALAEMAAADALLFYVALSSRAPSGKLYEYLVSGRPILCVARRDNLASELVSTWDAGVCATPDDGDAIEAAILELLARWRAGELQVSPEVRRRTLERYSRRALAGRLAAVLDESTSWPDR